MNHARKIVISGGALLSLLFAFWGLAAMFYWRYRTGSWIDAKVFDYEMYPPLGIGATLFFLHILPMFWGKK